MKSAKKEQYKVHFKGNNDDFNGSTVAEKSLAFKKIILSMIEDSFEDDDQLIEIDEFNGRSAGKITAVIRPDKSQDGNIIIDK